MNNFLDKTGLIHFWENIKTLFVPNTRKVNNKVLNTDITLSANDVGALPEDTNIVLIGESLGNVTYNEGGNT